MPSCSTMIAAAYAEALQPKPPRRTPPDELKGYSTKARSCRRPNGTELQSGVIRYEPFLMCEIIRLAGPLSGPLSHRGRWGMDHVRNCGLV